MTIKRVLVCGGRDFSATAFLYETMDRLHREIGFDVVIEGDARGVDRIAGDWAQKNKLDNLKFRPNYNLYGRIAPLKRNQQMLVEGKPDLVIAFPGGRGTADMIRRARAAEVEVLEISYDDAK